MTLAGVKAKAALSDTAYDTAATALIAELVMGLEFWIEPAALESSDTRLTSILDSAATEFVAGDLLAQIGREPGALDDLTVGDITLKARWSGDVRDPSGLKASAAARLAPFLRTDVVATVTGSAGVLTGAKPEAEG